MYHCSESNLSIAAKEGKRSCNKQRTSQRVPLLSRKITFTSKYPGNKVEENPRRNSWTYCIRILVPPLGGIVIDTQRSSINGKAIVIQRRWHYFKLLTMRSYVEVQLVSISQCFRRKSKLRIVSIDTIQSYTGAYCIRRRSFDVTCRPTCSIVHHWRAWQRCRV